MYTLGQMFNPTEFLNHYSLVVRLLAHQPRHLLVSHKSRKKFVFVPAEIFDELLSFRLSVEG